MLKYLLIAAGLALMAFGGHGLYQTSLNPPAQGAPNVLVFSIALGAGLTILVATLWLFRRESPPSPVATSPDDRAEVIERLYKHTEALRAATEAPPPPGPDIESGMQVAPEPDVVLAAEKEVAEGPPTPQASLPSIMLLDVGPDAGLDQIESAPPLGTRASGPASSQPMRVSSEPARVARAARRRADGERGANRRSVSGTGPERMPPARVTRPERPCLIGSITRSLLISSDRPISVSTAAAPVPRRFSAALRCPSNSRSETAAPTPDAPK